MNSPIFNKQFDYGYVSQIERQNLSDTLLIDSEMEEDKSMTFGTQSLLNDYATLDASKNHTCKQNLDCPEHIDKYV